MYWHGGCVLGEGLPTNVASKGHMRSRNCLLILFLSLMASPASAEDEYEDEGPPPLENSGRISLQTGWRYTPNTRLFDDYYAQPRNSGLTRAGGAIGGPLLTTTFAYSPREWLELGVDLFFTYERMRVTGLPGLNAVTFGAMLGLRFQKELELGPQGFIPFVGPLLGTTFTSALFDEGPSVETFAPTLGLTAGGTLRLSPEWGVTFEYRLTYARGNAEKLGPYDSGGHWLVVGMAYTFPTPPDRPLSRNF